MNLPTTSENVTALPYEMQNLFVWLKVLFSSKCLWPSAEIQPISQQVRQWRLTYIHTCRSYTTPTTITFWPPNTRAGRFVIHPVWASGEQSSTKCVIPCLERQWTAVQNLTPLALSSAKKSVTVQTHTHKITNKQTVNNIGPIHTLPRPIGVCG